MRGKSLWRIGSDISICRQQARSAMAVYDYCQSEPTRIQSRHMIMARVKETSAQPGVFW